MPAGPGDDAPIVEHLLHGELELVGRMPWSSNGTYLCEVRCGDAMRQAIYKPRRGERPLWDFPSGLDQREVPGGRAVGRGLEVVEQALEVVGQRGHLLLLTAHGDHEVAVAGLEVEHPLAGRADRAGGEHLRIGEVERSHDGTREVRSPVEFTARTTGPSVP